MTIAAVAGVRNSGGIMGQMSAPSPTDAVAIERMPVPPGQFGLPLLGETIAFGRDPTGFITSHLAQYGPVFATSLIGARTVVMAGEEALAWVFAGDGKYLENTWNSSTRRLLGASCTAMLTGAAHARRRHMLLPHFHQAALARFAPAIVAIADRHFAQWARDEMLTVLPAMQALVFEIIVTWLVGDMPPGMRAELGRYFRQWSAGIATLPLNLPFTPYRRALAARAAIFDCLDQTITRRGRLAAQPPDVLGSWLAVPANGPRLSQAEMVHELHNQLFAGHDTTATVMTNVMLQLAQHPDVLAQARDEIHAIPPHRWVDLGMLRQLPLLNAVLNESMRYLPPVGAAFRVMRRDMPYHGYRIPRDWTVRIEIAGTHADPALWSAPQRYDPYRWLPPRREQTAHRHCFIPFGGGARRCLGAAFAMAEMRIMLALLLGNYRWDPAENQDLRYCMLPFPQPRSGLQVSFRDHSARAG